MRAWERGSLVTSVFALLFSACMPFVHHGPWVREGGSGTILSGGAAAFDNRPRVIDEVTIGFDGSLRAGFVPRDSAAPAFSVGAQMPFFPFLLVAVDADDPGEALTLVSADAYITGPRFSSFATSAGVVASLYHVMPYAQVGSRSANRSGWYMTHAFAFIQNDFVETEADTFMWLPSITIYDPEPERGRATHLTIGGGLGSERGAAKYLFSIGVMIEYFRSDNRVR